MRLFRSVTSDQDANTYVGPFGEIVVTDNLQLLIQDNATPGGQSVPVYSASGNLVLPTNSSFITYPNGTIYGGGGTNTGNIVFIGDTISSNDAQSINLDPMGTGVSRVTVPYGISGDDLVVASNSHEWYFKADATLRLPVNGYVANSDGAIVSLQYSSGNLVVGSNATQTPINLLIGGLGPTHSWLFNSDGTTHFPGYIFPADDGTGGQILVTDGSGNLSWQNAGGSTGNVTFSNINIIGTGNLHLQPDPTNAYSYVDVYLTSGPDVHIASSNPSQNLILGRDDNANVTIGLDDNVTVQAYDGVSTAWTWVFDDTGTLTVPSPHTEMFTMVLDQDHYVPTESKPTLDLTGDPWTLIGQYVFGQNGEVELQVNDPFPQLTNPGYDSNDQFTFSAAVTKYSGYTLGITLLDVVYPGPAGWTASIAATAPPAYPTTVASQGAVVIRASTGGYTLGADGNFTLPHGGYIGKVYNDPGELSVVSPVDGYAALASSTGNTYIFADESGAYIGTNYEVSEFNWAFNANGTAQFPGYIFPAGDGSAGQALFTDGSGNLTWQNASGSTGNFTFAGDEMYMPLYATLNSGGDVYNAAQIGTQVNQYGNGVISDSTIYMGSGTGEFRSITQTPAIAGQSGPSLTYAGVENVAIKQFAGFVAADPTVNSQYSIAVDPLTGRIIIGNNTLAGTLTTASYVAGLGVTNALYDLNGVFVDNVRVVVSGGSLRTNSLIIQDEQATFHSDVYVLGTDTGFITTLGPIPNMGDSINMEATTGDQNGNVYATGFSSLDGTEGALVVKMDSTGLVLWSSRIDVLGWGEDLALGPNYLWVLSEITGLGTPAWGVNYIDKETGAQGPNNYIVQDINGNALVSGGISSGQQLVITGYNQGGSGSTGLIYSISNGWGSYIGDYTNTNTYIANAQDTPENNVYAVGNTYNSAISSTQLILSKYDSSGNPLWHATYTDQDGSPMTGFDVAVDSLGCATTIASNRNNVPVITKTDPNGNVLWMTRIAAGQTFGGGAFSVAVDDVGDVLIGGGYNADDTRLEDVFVAMLNGSEGGVIWQRNLGTAHNDGTFFTYGTRAISISGGNYNISGWTNIDGSSGADAFVASLPLNGAGLGTYDYWTYSSEDYPVDYPAYVSGYISPQLSPVDNIQGAGGANVISNATVYSTETIRIARLGINQSQLTDDRRGLSLENNGNSWTFGSDGTLYLPIAYTGNIAVSGTVTSVGGVYPAYCSPNQTIGIWQASSPDVTGFKMTVRAQHNAPSTCVEMADIVAALDSQGGLYYSVGNRVKSNLSASDTTFGVLVSQAVQQPYDALKVNAAVGSDTVYFTYEVTEFMASNIN